MLALLPLLALGTFIVAARARVPGWREATVYGAIGWGVVLVGITELLSLVHGLTVSGLAAAWSTALLVGCMFGVRAKTHRRLSFRASLHACDRLSLALLGPLAAMLGVMGAVAVLSPPNTWDSMTYHMARLIHWAQDASLEPYPTHILRQLYLEPAAEFALLHLQLLSGGDHLAGLVQWASMLGSLVVTGLIARDLGARWAGMLCATLFAASLPIGILEATSTQNDYVVAFWCVCVMAVGVGLTGSGPESSDHRQVERALTGEARQLGAGRPPRSRLEQWVGARFGRHRLPMAAFGAAVGLAMLAKATAYLVVLPILVWVTVCQIRRWGRAGFGSLVLAGAIALALNLGFYARNLVVFGSPVGPLDEGAPSLTYVNAAFTPPLLVSNLVRDVAINLNATPFAAINVRTVNAVRLVHAWMGVDIADPRTTWGDQPFQEQPAGLAFDENFASNPVHLALLVLGLAAAWPLHRRDALAAARGAMPCLEPRISGQVTRYALVVLAGFVLFTVVLRWQPWNTRLELPFFVLGAPVVGVLAERLAPRFAVGLAAMLLVSMLPWVVYNQARPLVGPRSVLAISRSDQYFTNRPTMRTAYLGAIAYLAERSCARVGFVSSVDGWEYPLLPLLQTAVPGSVEIEHVGVDNASAAHTTRIGSQFEPCAVLALGPAANMLSIDVRGKTFEPSWTQLDPSAVLEQVAVLTVDGR